MGMISPLSVFILNAAILLLVYVGALRMENMANSISAGDIFAVMQYIALVTNAVLMCAFAIVMYPHAKVAADRISQVMQADGMQETQTVRTVNWQGGLTVDHVTFSYEGAAEPAVKDLVMEIRPGEKIAVIGGTGSGKSTLVQLLLGFYAPTEGRIFFDGVSAEEISMEEIRAHISCVLQKTAIYSGTIGENIRMGNPAATQEQLEEAAEIAQIHDFIDSLKDGYAHELQQAGNNLSGGQKQRICIARSVLKQGTITIYDDSFSALDFMTESRVRAGLNRKLQGKTQILITQRVTSAMHADRIYVLHQGVIQDTGTHEELLERCQIYQEIYQSQTGGCEL